MTPALIQQLDKLVSARYVNLRVNPVGLRIYKYNKSVFFKNVWKQNPLLTEARGIVLDQEGNIVSYPLSKVFNDGEWSRSFNKEESVVAVEKIDGFMAAVTWHKDKLLITSTGTFDSDYVALATRWLDVEPIRWMCREQPQLTFIFEIVDSSAPKIIEQETGAYLIGAREKFIGSKLVEENILDILYGDYLKESIYKFYRPYWERTLFGSIVDACDQVHAGAPEGYVCYNEEGKALKVKTQSYLVVKFLSRTDRNLAAIWDDQPKALRSLPDHFAHFIEQMPEWHSAEEWKDLDTAEKLKTLHIILSGV